MGRRRLGTLCLRTCVSWRSCTGCSLQLRRTSCRCVWALVSGPSRPRFWAVGAVGAALPGRLGRLGRLGLASWLSGTSRTSGPRFWSVNKASTPVAGAPGATVAVSHVNTKGLKRILRPPSSRRRACCLGCWVVEHQSSDPDPSWDVFTHGRTSLFTLQAEHRGQVHTCTQECVSTPGRVSV
eukprot:100636-Chlamydomonas_euryale.AAC.2